MVNLENIVRRPYISVIVPAYNEVRSISSTIDSIRSYLSQRQIDFEIIVAADGNDGTRDVVTQLSGEDARIILLGSTRRGGKGRAVREGIMRARGEIVGFLDADYKTPIDELKLVLPMLMKGYDIAIGSRRNARAKIEVAQPWIRRTGSKAFSFVLHMLLGLRDIEDTQCGFKFFKRKVARAIFSRQKIDGYMFDVEILRIAKLLGYRIAQVGVHWRDDNDSRYNIFSGTWRNATELLRIRMTSVRPTIQIETESAPYRHAA